MRITGDGGIGASSGYPIHGFSGDVKAERLTVTLGATIKGSNFNVDSEGNMWLGAASFDSAPFKVSSAGVVTANSGTFSGNILGATFETDVAPNRRIVIDSTASANMIQFHVPNQVTYGVVRSGTYISSNRESVKMRGPRMTSSWPYIDAEIWVVGPGAAGEPSVALIEAEEVIIGVSDNTPGFPGSESVVISTEYLDAEFVSGGVYVKYDSGSQVFRLYSPSTNASTNIQFYGNNVRQGYVGYPNTDDLRIWNEASSGILDFGTQGLSRFWINNSGFVTVGNSSSPQNIQFRVYGARTDTNPVAFIWNTTSTPSNTVRVLDLYMNTGTANPGTDDDFIRFRRGDGTVVGEIRGTGAGGVTYAVSSDQQLKKNITAELNEAVQAFDLIPWKSFTWRTTGVRAHGVIAQEVVEVPEWEHVVNRGGIEVGEDPETGEPQEYNKHWAVDYVPFIGAIGAKLVDVDRRLKALEER